MSYQNDEKPIRVAIYIRVSTAEQNISGYWMEMQEHSLEDLVKNFKWKYNKWMYDEKLVFRDDWYSWGDLNRPEFKRMMTLVKENKIDIIAVYKIDRISRNLSHLLSFFEEIQKHWASFFSLKENVDFSWSIWKLTFQIFWALAEFERETIRTRTAEWKIASARMGNFVSNAAPYWYIRIDNTKTNKWKVLEVVLEEKKRIETIFDWFVYEWKNYSQIAKELNKLKIIKWKGSLSKNKLSLWYDSDIVDILRNSAYNWIMITRIKDWNWITQEITTEVPRIINETLYLQTYYKIKHISETKGMKWWWRNIYLLSRKLYYKESWRWFVWYERAKWGYWYRHKKFIDNNWTIFENVEIPAYQLDNFVWDIIKLAINNPKEFYKLYQKQTIQEEELEINLKKQEKLARAIIETEDTILSLEDEYLKWGITEERKNILLDRYEKTINETKNKLEKLDDKISKLIEAKTSQDALDKFSKNFRKSIDNLNIEQKRVIVDMLIDKIEVYKIEWEIRVDIFFRFAKSRVENDNNKGEPTQGSNETKNPLAENFSVNLEEIVTQNTIKSTYLQKLKSLIGGYNIFLNKARR